MNTQDVDVGSEPLAATTTLDSSYDQVRTTGSLLVSGVVTDYR